MIRLSDLEGRWVLSRVIEDARAGMTGQLEGVATWTADGAGFVQDEVGTLTYGSAPPMQATRRYLWRAQGTETHVFFEDGRPFHVLPDRGKEAVHHCDPDLYRVTYEFALPDRFTQVWRVTGPRKDAQIISRFSRT